MICRVYRKWTSPTVTARGSRTTWGTRTDRPTPTDQQGLYGLDVILLYGVPTSRRTHARVGNAASHTRIKASGDGLHDGWSREKKK